MQVYSVFKNSIISPIFNGLLMKIDSECIGFGEFLWYLTPEMFMMIPRLVEISDNESKNENSFMFALLKFISVGFPKTFLQKGGKNMH